MSMTEKEMKYAFREAMSREFQDIPSSEEKIELEFSEDFLQKMETVVAHEKKEPISAVRKPARRALLTAAVIPLLIACVLGVSAVSEPTRDFSRTHFKDHVDYAIDLDDSFDGTIYTITDLPEGFEEMRCKKDTTFVETWYENQDGDSIILTQIIGGEHDIAVDNEHGMTEIIEMPERTVYLCMRTVVTFDSASAMWAENGCIIMIHYNGNIERDKMLDIVESVK